MNLWTMFSIFTTKPKDILSYQRNFNVCVYVTKRRKLINSGILFSSPYQLAHYHAFSFPTLLCSLSLFAKAADTVQDSAGLDDLYRAESSESLDRRVKDFNRCLITHDNAR